jgi:hypothetical protein
MQSTKMSPRIQKQIAKSREQALAAFVSKKAEIDEMLTRLQALSDDHFNYSPDEITWDHVGTLGTMSASRAARPAAELGSARRLRHPDVGSDMVGSSGCAEGRSAPLSALRA